MIASLPAWAGILRCPLCEGRVAQGDGWLACTPCGEIYPCQGNVPVMIPAGYRERGAKESSELFAQRSEHGEGYLGSGTPERVRGRVASLLAKYKVPALDRSRILEVGCGPFESLHDVPGEVKIGVDPLAGSYGSALPVPRLRSNLVEAFAEALPFPDGFFDVVVSRNSLDHLNDPELALMEIRRILKPGGRCVIECYLDSDPLAAHEPFVLTDRFVDRFLARHFEILSRRRVPRGEGRPWDWAEIAAAPREGNPGHRPYPGDIFRRLSESYLELFSRGCLLEAGGDREGAIRCLEGSVEAREEYFWNSAYLVYLYRIGGRTSEGRELARRIRENARRGFYPYVDFPERALEGMVGPDPAEGLRTRLALLLSRWARGSRP